MFLIFTNEFKIGFQIGNYINKTGNGIISHNSTSLINEYLLQKLSHFYHAVQNCFSTQELELEDKGIILHTYMPQIKKNTFDTMFHCYQSILN